MTMEPELQPDAGEILQEEAPDVLTAIPVCVADVQVPVRVQVLPRKGGSTKTRTMGTLAGRLLTADHWRASAVLLSVEQDMLISFSEAGTQDVSAMTYWPKLVPFVVTATVEVWVASVTGTTQVSVTTERWAEG